MATAGGQEVCVWDVLGGTRLLHRAATHQKTVTCLHVAAAAGADSATRLLSASLDGLLKVRARDAQPLPCGWSCSWCQHTAFWGRQEAITPFVCCQVELVDCPLGFRLRGPASLQELGVRGADCHFCWHAQSLWCGVASVVASTGASVSKTRRWQSRLSQCRVSVARDLQAHLGRCSSSTG